MKNKKIIPILIVILLLTGIGILAYFQISQSIVSISTYEDSSGDYHWLIEGVANNIDEGYTFRSLPSKITESDGKTITPKETATLYMSKDESYCSYQIKEVQVSKLLGLFKMTYYTLQSAERVATIKIRDDSGTTRVVDGTITKSVSFYDNGGELEVTTLGTLSAKKDCPDGDDVAIYYTEDRIMKVKYRSDLLNFLDNLLVNIALRKINIKDNTNFISTFDGYSIKNERFIGDVDIGNVNFIIDADQDYYNSVVYTPAKEVDPKIDSIKVSDIQKGDSGSVKLVISNKENSEGTISIDASVTYGSISPESKNIVLSDKLTQYFTIKAPNSKINNNKVCFEVCSTSSPINCDDSCTTFDVTEDEPEVKCGDGICQDSESYITCPKDCNAPVECVKDSDCDYGYTCENGVCLYEDDIKCYTFFQNKVVKTKSEIKFLGITIRPETSTTYCKNKPWVNWTIFFFILLTVGVIIYLIKFKPKVKK
jgi:hypothetical protein